MSPSTPNLSLQKKSAARIMAVQCLYRQTMNGEEASPAEHIATLKEQLSNNRDEQKLLIGSAIEPHYALAETLLSGINERKDDIDKRLDGALTKDWKRERMSPLLVAILQCAIYELFFGKEIAPRIVIDEYTRITRRFFADAEVHFVHGALSELAKKYG